MFGPPPPSIVDPELFFRTRIPFSSEYWIQILLDEKKVSDPISDPTLNIHSHNANDFKGLFITF
jgi:hypothetical protein